MGPGFDRFSLALSARPHGSDGGASWVRGSDAEKQASSDLAASHFGPSRHGLAWARRPVDIVLRGSDLGGQASDLGPRGSDRVHGKAER
jgi:hypothetical protein